jgi:hypothetical protein
MNMKTAQIIELSNEQLVTVAPSIGAVQPYCEVSERYSFVPTIKAVDFLRDSGWLPVMAGQSMVRKEDKAGYQRHMIRFTRPDLVVNGHRMDLLLYNSHDRGCAFKMVAGVFRFVCSNGLVVGDKMAEFSHKHINFSPDKFIESARFLGGYSEQVAGVIEDWQTIQMNQDEQGIFAQAAHSLVYDEPEKAPVRADQLLARKRREDCTDNLWTTLNTVQENVMKGGLRGRNTKGGRTTTRPVRDLDRSKKLNQALWMLTERMAELKA